MFNFYALQQCKLITVQHARNNINQQSHEVHLCHDYNTQLRTSADCHPHLISIVFFAFTISVGNYCDLVYEIFCFRSLFFMSLHVVIWTSFKPPYHFSKKFKTAVGFADDILQWMKKK